MTKEFKMGHRYWRLDHKHEEDRTYAFKVLKGNINQVEWSEECNLNGCCEVAQYNWEGWDVEDRYWITPLTQDQYEVLIKLYGTRGD